MSINIDELTYKQIKEISSLVKGGEVSKPHPYKIGESYLFRTVTMIQVGRLEAVYEDELMLSSASWVADTGRFYNALKTGKLDEVEPFPNDVGIGRGSIVDFTIWTHSLPKEQQ